MNTFIQAPELITTLIIVIIISTIAIWGITQSITITAFLTLIETFGLGMIIYVGFGYVSWDTQTLESFTPPMEFTSLNAIILSAFLAFYAFIGFEDMVHIAEEVKNPTKTMPKAIIITLLIATLFYITIAIISISVVPVNELAHCNAPLAKVYETATDSKATILSVITLFAVINGALIQIIMASRIFYGMSNQGWLPGFLQYYKYKHKNPHIFHYLSWTACFSLSYFISYTYFGTVHKFSYFYHIYTCKYCTD